MAIYYTNLNKNEITVGTFKQILPLFLKDRLHYKVKKIPFKFTFRIHSYNLI